MHARVFFKFYMHVQILITLCNFITIEGGKAFKIRLFTQFSDKNYRKSIQILEKQEGQMPILPPCKTATVYNSKNKLKIFHLLIGVKTNIKRSG